ncbi:MAG TPA: GntR family transcriptional regulator [Puia sp.]|jgi:DNA-binding GntR family transcriptional regulator
MKADSLANKAFVEIRRKILSSQLAPHTRLKEDEWAKKLGVSRMAVREALTRLLGEDMLVLGEKGGYYIKPLLPVEIHEIRELREVLELGAMRLAYKKMTRDQLEKLEKICDDYAAMVKNGYFNGALEADMKFHETLMEYAGNSKLLQVYRSSHIPLFHQKLGKTQIEIVDHEQTDGEHRQIIKALKEKNLNLAESTMIKQFSRGEATLLDIT